jgi:hypothetical protein
MSLCASCERKIRRGVGSRALVLEPSGQLRPGIVCPRCLARRVTIVAPPPTTVAPLCSGCREHPASYCAACVARLSEQIRELTGANVARAIAQRAPLCSQTIGGEDGDYRCGLEAGHLGDHHDRLGLASWPNSADPATGPVKPTRCPASSPANPGNSVYQCMRDSGHAGEHCNHIRSWT